MADTYHIERAFENLTKLTARVGLLAIRGSLDDFQRRDIAECLRKVANEFDATAPADDETFERHRQMVEEVLPEKRDHGTLVTSGGFLDVDALLERLHRMDQRIERHSYSGPPN